MLILTKFFNENKAKKSKFLPVKMSFIKSINSNLNISEYNQSSDETVPYKKFFLSYQVNPYLSYQTTEKWAIQLKSTFRFQNHEKSIFYDLNHSSLLYGLSVGFVYTP
ncbi:MAG: hypothetical protein ACI9LN_003349 [Saprospiraceae bacterium]|jgi:hypothetical protein